jgi:hypothetical protein
MNNLEEAVYERKMDQVSEEIEELVLDAIISALKKIRKRNLAYINSLNFTQNDINF